MAYANECDCTEVFPAPLIYDRMTELGVPYYNHYRAYCAKDFYESLLGLSRQAIELHLFPVDESGKSLIKGLLTGGVYVNRPGAHGAGLALDFDGYLDSKDVSWLYKAGIYWNDGQIKSMGYKLGVRLAALASLHFGVVLTRHYNSRHADHIHFDKTMPVGWRGSRSQILILQEILVYWYDCSDLKIDGIIGPLTKAAWYSALGVDRVEHYSLWLETCRRIARGEP